MKFKNLAKMTDTDNMSVAQMPDIDNVIDIFKKISGQSTGRIITDEKAAELFNDELAEENIEFRKSHVIDSAYSRLEGTLYDRNMYRIGDIYKDGDKCVLEYLPGFGKIMEKNTSYEIFMKYIIPCIGHELIHMKQGVSGGTVKMSEKYLSQHHELMAFAYVAACELYRKYKGNWLLMKEHVDNDMTDAKSLPHFTIYMDMFKDKNPELIEKFKHYIMDYLNSPELFKYLD